MLVYGTMRSLTRLAAGTICPVSVDGAHHVPATGPVLLAGNHLSGCDTFFLMAVLRRRLVFFGKHEYFHTPGLKGRAVAATCARMGFLPVDRRGGPAAARAVVAHGAEVLRRGAPLVIYPEGTRSPDGRLYRGRPGTAAIALASGGVPLVPFGIAGTDRVQPIGRSLLRPHPVRIRFGRALGYGAYLRRPARPDGLPTSATLRELTLVLMDRVRELSGQEYVDAFAPSVRR